MKQNLLQQVIGLGLVLLLVACSAPATPTPVPASSTFVPPTATETPIPPTATLTSIPPTSTQSLPDATSAPQMTLVNTLPGIEIVDAYMSTDFLITILGSGERPSSTIFPSGTEKLYTILVLCPAPKGNIRIDTTITGPSGVVAELGQLVVSTTVEYPEGCISVDQEEAPPQSGAFPDGPYQTTISIDGTDVIVLNWTVGTP